MTREEACNTCVDNTSALGEAYTHRQTLARNLVFCLEALGLLTFNRSSEKPRQMAANIIADLPPHDRQSNEIIAALEAAGLEIVERK